MIARIVTSALTGAAEGSHSSGVSANMSKMMGMTVTGISMMTVPATVGVRIRRKKDRFTEMENWPREERATSVASIAGPPSASAVMQTAMNAPEVPISRTYPAPIRPNRTACRMVVAPLIRTAANTADER